MKTEKHYIRTVVTVDYMAHEKAAETVAKRANAFAKHDLANRPRKLNLTVPGIVACGGPCVAAKITDGPADRKTGLPKYRVIALKLREPASKPAMVAPVKKAKVRQPKAPVTAKSAPAPVADASDLGN